MGTAEFRPNVTSEPMQPALEGMVLESSRASADIAEAADVIVIAPLQTEPDAQAASSPRSKHYLPRHANGMQMRFERNRTEPRHAAMRQPLVHAAFNLLRRRRDAAQLASHVALESIEMADSVANVELASHA